jgi:hypothetical protein
MNSKPNILGLIYNAPEGSKNVGRPRFEIARRCKE